MKRLRDFFSNPEKTAWSLAAASLAAVLAGMILILSGARKPRIPESHADSELLRERMLLQARVNVCNFEKSADRTRSRTNVCDPSEEKRVEDYRKRIAEIDRTLGASL